MCSQINGDVAKRLRAAKENVALGRLVEWLRSIDNLTGNQAGLTVVTDSSPA